jgi:hypothetical protein
MARIESTSDPNVTADVDKTMQALRVTLRPMQAYGYYRTAFSTGVLAALAAGAELAQFRWTDASYIMLISLIRLRYTQIATSVSAAEVGVDVLPATGYTAQPASGFTATGNATTWLKRNTFPQSKLLSFQYANTAGLSVGTRSAGAYAYLAGYTYAPASTLSQPLEIAADMSNSSLSYPLVLGQNEGIIIRNLVAFPASATFRLSVEMAWTEVLATQFPTYT